jgi:D-alanyl-D-alanine carboxypeptidase
LRSIRGFKFDLLKLVSCILTISLVLAFILLPYKVCSANEIITFPDLTGEWQKEAVYWAVDKGIVHGYEDGTFRPNQKITEAEFALMIAKSVSSNDLSMANPLGDAQWAQPAYDELSQYGLPLLGYKDPQVKNSPLSRGQAAKIIARIYGFDLNVAEAVDFMYENDLSQGSGGKKDFENYRAFESLSRAEAISLISAMYHNSQVTFIGIQSSLSDGKITEEVLYRSMDLPVDSEMSTSGSYALFQGKIYLSSFADVSLAKEKGRQFANTYIIDQKDKKLLWSNFDREIEFTDSTNQGDLFLINQSYPVSRDYKASEMVNTAAYTSKYLRVSDNDMYVDEVVFDPLKSLLNDIYNNGATKLVLLSTYRSYETQNKLFQGRVNAMKSSLGLENALKKVANSTALPGSSEHQTGLAIDFSTNPGLSQFFSNTKEGQWLNTNSWKYGFVVRYASDKMNITGIISEPWHLRYVGVPHAAIIYKSGLCLEEYLDYIRNERMLQFSDYQGNTYKIYYFDSIHSEDLLSFLYLSDGIQSISGDGKGGVIVTTK